MIAHSVELSGQWQDGQTSKSIDAHLTITESGWLRVHNQDQHLADDNIKNIVVSDRLGNIPRTLSFGDAGTFITSNNDAVDQALKAHEATNWLRYVAVLESKYHTAIISLFMVIGLATLTYLYVIPFAAQRIAQTLPESVIKKAEDYTLNELNIFNFEASDLPDERQQQLRSYFKQFDNSNRQILFKKSDLIGANAFALPYSTIIFTDGMVELAENDDELLSIYFHETGHIQQQHGTRTVLQASVIGLLFAFIIGDSSGIAESVYAIPAFLMHSAYSRKFEVEADDHAYQKMLEHQIPLHHFANIMQRIEDSYQDPENRDNNAQIDKVKNYLSTHPLTKKRVERFK